jgi:hypothetical protein
MSKDAANFAYQTKLAWDNPSAEHDANVRARRLGAAPIGAAHTPNVWFVTPNDAPPLYRFADGSEYVVANDGHWITAPRGRGRRC